MLALFIDTSTETKVFAILNKERIISKCSCLSFSKTIDETLFSWLQETTKKHKIILAELTCIAVGYGPGPSFTGIRTGVALASSLAYAYSLPVVGLCSLELFKPINNSNVFYNISNARGGELYYVESRENINTYEFTMPKVMNIDGWQENIAKNSVPIISMQYEFFQEIIGKKVKPAIINWEYIIKKIFQTSTYIDPLFLTIPYFKNPR